MFGRFIILVDVDKALTVPGGMSELDLGLEMNMELKLDVASYICQGKVMSQGVLVEMFVHVSVES